METKLEHYPSTLDGLLSTCSDEWKAVVFNLRKKYEGYSEEIPPIDIISLQNEIADLITEGKFAEAAELMESAKNRQPYFEKIIKPFIMYADLYGPSAELEKDYQSKLEHLFQSYFNGGHCVFEHFIRNYEKADDKKAAKREYMAFLARLTPCIIELYPFVEEYAQKGYFQKDCENISALRRYFHYVVHATKLDFYFNDDEQIDKIVITHHYGKENDSCHWRRAEGFNTFFNWLKSELFSLFPDRKFDSCSPFLTKEGNNNFIIARNTLAGCINSVLPTPDDGEGKRSNGKGNKKRLAEHCAKLFSFLMTDEFFAIYPGTDISKDTAIDWIYELLGLAWRFPDTPRDKERFLRYITEKEFFTTDENLL